MGFPLAAQDTTTARPDSTVAVTVTVRRDTIPLEYVMVRSGQIGRPTDSRGVVVLRLPPGAHSVIARKIGFQPESVQVTLRTGADTTLLG